MPDVVFKGLGKQSRSGGQEETRLDQMASSSCACCITTLWTQEFNAGARNTEYTAVRDISGFLCLLGFVFCGFFSCKNLVRLRCSPFTASVPWLWIRYSVQKTRHHHSLVYALLLTDKWEIIVRKSFWNKLFLIKGFSFFTTSAQKLN